MDTPEIIRRKRDGGALSAADIEDMVAGITSGRVGDEQVGALLMAIYLNGMHADETVALTRAMLESGEQLRWGDGPPVVDKHSTGGVGDKISLPLAPALAACGVRVPMISGRGLGHTGGTLDKLESIPGYEVRHAPASIRAIVDNVGTLICGQTATIAPADRRLYAIRDVTATVESIPLITASILSKKVAAGLHALVLDVKCGQGAFMADATRARALATSLVAVGRGLGVETSALLTDMHDPLGRTVGNALEVIESIECLQGAGAPDVVELVAALGGEALALAGVAPDADEGAARITTALANGAALERFGRMVEAAGGDRRVIDDPRALLPSAPEVTIVESPGRGSVAALDSLAIARVALHLGAGRLRKEDPVDHAVGVEVLAPRGARLERGDPLFRVHSRAPLDDAVRRRLTAAVTLNALKTAPAPRTLEVLR